MKHSLLSVAVLLGALLGCGDDTADSNRGLAAECQAYLDAGPPLEMTDYVPDSLTEIVISYGAQSKPLDAELQEVARLIIMESQSLEEIKDPKIKAYMLKGAALVGRVLESQ